MKEDGVNRKNLYLSWFLSSALVTLMIIIVVPSIIQQPSDISLITIMILYVIVLFIWLIPFLIVRAFFASIMESRKKRAL